jgi:thymidylate kinase
MAENCILLFSGCDKTGKTTIIKEILKRTNKHICVDRFAACQTVYGNIHNKLDTPPGYIYSELEKFLSKSPLPVVYIHTTATTYDIQKRFKEHNEKDIELDQIDEVKESYIKYFESHKHLPVIELDTSHKNLDDCVNYIFWYISFL